jgi:hypothetical protein
LVQDGVIVFRKKRFSLSGSGHRKLFFSICESQFVVPDPRYTKKIQDGGDFQDGICTFYQAHFWGVSLFFDKIMLIIEIELFGPP